MTQPTDHPQSPSHPAFPPPLMVDTSESLQELGRTLHSANRIAVDTESNSLHAYYVRVCLIQVSTDEQDYLVDPLALDGEGNLAFLGDLFADPAVEKVLHAAEYDVMTMHRDFGFEFANIFDTMIAARVLGWEQIGLGTILKERFGVVVNKRHQRANWGRRPLPSDLVRYARMDTHFLLPLRDEMHALLEAGDQLEEAREMFDEVCQARWNGTEFDPEGYWRISGARDLLPRSLAVLRELYLAREQQAANLDIPVFKVLGDKTLVALAKAKPRTLREIQRIRGISDLQVRRYGVAILKAVKKGLKMEPPSPPRRNGPLVDDLVLRRYDALRTWRKERANLRGVGSDIILSKDVLWELAKSAPRNLDEMQEVEHLGPWRVQKYGEEILGVLAAVEQAQILSDELNGRRSEL